MLKYLLKSAIWAVEASYNTTDRKGARGERLVHSALTSALNSQDYRVLTDLILPVAGGTTQIDHLILSRFGIFVIETKNMSGWIFGSADQAKWTQVQKRSKRQFQNPLRQNYAHVKAVEEILEVEPKALHNLVVFTGTAEPKTKMPDSVAWGLRDLGRLIALKNQTMFSEEQLDTYSKKLRDRALENTKTVRSDHLQSVRNKAAVRSRPDRLDQTACPKCGSEMVKRTGRKTGSTFWGCTSFPKCRGTRNVD